LIVFTNWLIDVATHHWIHMYIRKLYSRRCLAYPNPTCQNVDGECGGATRSSFLYTTVIFCQDRFSSSGLIWLSTITFLLGFFLSFLLVETSDLDTSSPHLSLVFFGLFSICLWFDFGLFFTLVGLILGYFRYGPIFSMVMSVCHCWLL